MPATPETDCVVAPHREWLLRLIGSRLRGTPLHREGEEDVLQEVAVAALRSNNLPAAEDDLRRWLCRLTLRQCALALRTGARRQGALERAGVHSANSPTTPDDPIHWLIAIEDQTLLRRAVAELDETSRRLILWKHVERIGYADIAQRLGVSRHSAEYRLLRARRLLRRRLTEMGLTPEGES